MAMTVTATMSGTAANEHIYLWIRVLTGATEAGGASSTGIAASGGTTISASLTPAGTNSLPCFAVTGDNFGTAYTALANNTVDSSSADADTWEAGFGRYTGTVTAATPVTFGVNAGGGGVDYSTWACYEVLSSGGTTPAVDASSPVLASATGASVKTVTSASFTPPAGSVVVAMICGGGGGSSGTFVMTVTDTGGGLTWTKRAGSPTVTDQDSFVFTATVPGGAGGGSAPAAVPAQPGQAWRRRFRHRQQVFPLGVAPVGGTTASAAGAGAVTDVVTQAVTATSAGAGSVTAATGKPYIAGIGGTGAGYFIDQTGKPRMVIGDAPWALPGNAGRWNSGNWQADYDTYLGNRAAQGYTVIYTKPIGTTQSGNIDDNGKTFDALYPFQGGSPSTGVAAANPSTGLTSAFWARIDYMLNSALAKGVTIFLNAIGYNSDFNGGPGPLNGKSTTEFTAYGTAMGGRYKNQPNIVWLLADDYFGGTGPDALITAFLSGLTGAGDTHVVSIENMAESDSRWTFDASPTALTWGTANAQFNDCYSYNVTYVGVEKAYLESSPITVIQGDGYFYQGSSTYSSTFDRAMRQDAWHAISSGARGAIQGSESIWQYQSTALAASSTDWYYANNAGNIRTLMESLPNWQHLIPDTSSVLVTAGRGTHASTFASGGGGGQYEIAFTDSYVTASRCADSSLAVIYMSHATTITIDQTKMASGYTATWVDPVTCATSSATVGSTYNSTAKGSNSKGDPDWVLVLQGPTGSTGTASAAGAGSVTAVATVIAPATAAGTGVTSAAAAEIPAIASIAGAGSATAKAVQAVTATAPGAGAVTDVVTQAVTATSAGAGAASAAATEIAGASAAGSGAVTDVVTQVAVAAAAGAGSVTAAGSVSGLSSGTASAAAAGAITAVATQIVPATAAGAGSVAAVATQAATATAAGAGAVTALATQGAVASVPGAGVAGPSPVTQAATAAPAGGAGAVTDVATQVVTATAAGAGSVTAIASSSGAATANAAGAGGVTAVATQVAPASAAAAGAVTGVVTEQATGTVAGAGAATAIGGQLGGGTASAAAAGAVTAVATVIATATATGAGAVTTTATQAAKATAAGAAAVNASGAIPGTASIAGAGAATAKATQPVTATAAGAGVLSALATQAATAALAGAGAASASGHIQLAFTVGTLTATAQPLATMTATAAAGSTTGGVLTATATSTGGPGG